ncbi:hypothetical protein EYC80_011087 [Monilinia laxa]|uniref:Uncharacterized protein n=1 Tax=Monilinia laxa TaxID=61186 RepID=A0A5N6JRW5_MONLA|nr:hypothetical protein EYC80_011087 [Monilinia laxa]
MRVIIHTRKTDVAFYIVQGNQSLFYVGPSFSPLIQAEFWHCYAQLMISSRGETLVALLCSFATDISSVDQVWTARLSHGRALRLPTEVRCGITSRPDSSESAGHDKSQHFSYDMPPKKSILTPS